MKYVLALASMKKILIRNGAKRVSAGAIKELRKVMEHYSDKIASDAVRLAKDKKRPTVMEEDVSFVSR